MTGAKWSKFKTPSVDRRNKLRYANTNNASISKVRLTNLPGGEKGIEMKDFSATLLRKNYGGIPTSFSTDKSNVSRSMIGSSAGGVPRLEFDSQSPVTDNCARVSTGGDGHLQTPGKKSGYDNLPAYPYTHIRSPDNIAFPLCTWYMYVVHW